MIDGAVIKIVNFTVEKNELTVYQKARINHELKLVINFASKVSPMEDIVSIPQNAFSFTKFSDIEVDVSPKSTTKENEFILGR